MIETPQVIETKEQPAAVIRFTIPRAEMMTVMGPAIAEIMGAVADQGMVPAGPVFAYHFRMDPGIFDFEVGVPVKRPISPAGRVKPGRLPAVRAVRTVYHGPYEGLPSAWGELMDWIAAEGHEPAPELWERYLTTPEEEADASRWRTELNKPLKQAGRRS